MITPEQQKFSNRLLNAAAVCDIEAMREQISQGARVNYTDTMGRTPLMYMIDAKKADKKAVQAGVQLLLEAGAEIDAVDRDGKTALMQAMTRLNPDMAEILVAAGADVNKKSKESMTAQDYAERAKTLDIGNRLRKKLFVLPIRTIKDRQHDLRSRAIVRRPKVRFKP